LVAFFNFYPCLWQKNYNLSQIKAVWDIALMKDHLSKTWSIWVQFKTFFRNLKFSLTSIASTLKVLLILNIFFLESSAIAYIPPTKMILQKVTENSGAGPYAIEQLVEFYQGLDTSILVRENWIIENDHSLRLTVTGEKNLKNTFKLNYIYTGSQRWTMEGGNKISVPIPRELIQRFFHFKSTEALASYLLKEQILPSNYLNRKSLPPKSSEISFQPESWIRLARLGGVVNWTIGTPSSEGEILPGIWIEQDQFNIRKIRLASLAEMTAEGFKEFSKGLFYPEKQTIKWNTSSASIRLVSVKSLQAKSFQGIQPSSIESSNHIEGLVRNSAQIAVSEFYSRFR